MTMSANPDETVSVVIIEDHQVLAMAFEVALQEAGGFRVLATEGTLARGLRAVKAFGPDLVICDRRLPDGDVEDHLGALSSASPSSGILLMTGWPTERALLAALASGAHGIVTKDQPLAEVVSAVRRVAAGEAVVPPWLVPALLDGVTPRPRDRRRLTPREVDVLELLAAGNSTSEAAEELCISVNTLRNHLSSAMAKLGATSRVGAIAAALRSNLVSPPLPSGSQLVG